MLIEKYVIIFCEIFKNYAMPFTISSLVSYEETLKKSFQAGLPACRNEQAVKDFLRAI